METKAFSFTHRTKVSPGGTGVSRPISGSEVASEALSVYGRLNST